jgi:hypothetical protein
MKKIVLAALAATTAVSGANATSFSYAQTINGNVAAGTFDGDIDSSDLITNLTNVTLSINGNAVTNLFILSYTGATFVNGGAQISLSDHTLNDFLFINSDYVAFDYSYTDYFYNIPAAGLDRMVSLSQNIDSYAFPSVGVTVTRLGDGAVPEPASWAMFIGGFGLVGAGMRSRRKAAVSFG